MVATSATARKIKLQWWKWVLASLLRFSLLSHPRSTAVSSVGMMPAVLRRRCGPDRRHCTGSSRAEEVEEE